MQTPKDLSWLSVPSFLLILGILAIYTLKQPTQPRHPEKVKSIISSLPTQKIL